MRQGEEDEGSAEWTKLWLGVSEELVAGVHHALNNRLASVRALSQLVLGGEDLPADLRDGLLDEIDRLEETLRLLRPLGRHGGAEPIPLALPDVCPEVLALARQHRDVGALEIQLIVEPGGSAVLVDETRLLQLALALVVTGIRAASSARAPDLRFRVGGDELHAFLRVELEREATFATRQSGLTHPATALGGELTVEPAALSLRLPSLSRARAGE